MENTFKPYGRSKKELALLYKPELCPKAAVRSLMRWIKKCSSLSAELYATGYCRNNKSFTSPQVRLIVRHLGEP